MDRPAVVERRGRHVGSSFAGLGATAQKSPRTSRRSGPTSGPRTVIGTRREGGAMRLQMFWASSCTPRTRRKFATTGAFGRGVGRPIMWQWLRATPCRPGETPLGSCRRWRRRCWTTTAAAHTTSSGSEYNFAPLLTHADIPGAFSGGWYDPYSVGAVAYFSALWRTKRSPQRLMLGPGRTSACAATWRNGNEVDFGPGAIWG